ncbi:B-box zinc finger domain-containing protein [Cryptosporidium muris RN66]|uniref:B-box zinc finger domain-containing protein n=1 Tax=Cryptosporidium muris (strain RN66) TaxID=441375 RepID=B6A9V8_CRYMR|nr:B-box zinc finger domain-containing protein [Cryptosporidium muris RN66]EEA04999.1 B-box zinc finger domain-containing protein [Cryptosporidium muris RN66]|eukprot:XP_002139348.1 B-box zinc finger domain-containing protein [Cryptosporidium muris RN66]
MNCEPNNSYNPESQMSVNEKELTINEQANNVNFRNLLTSPKQTRLLLGNMRDILDPYSSEQNSTLICHFCNCTTMGESYILLSCRHRLHYSCVLNNMFNFSPNGEFMFCPICNFHSAILDNTGEPIVKHLARIPMKESFGCQPTKSCIVCKIRPPSTFCIDCCDSFCKGCLRDFHTSTISLRSHTIRQVGNEVDNVKLVPIPNGEMFAKEKKILNRLNGPGIEDDTKRVLFTRDQKTKSLAIENCPVHNLVPAEYFCLTCENTCFCETCALGMHRDHKVLMSIDAVEYIRDVLRVFQHVILTRTGELDSVSRSTSEWTTQQLHLIDEVKPVLISNTTKACNILQAKVDDFRTSILKEWFENEDIVAKEIDQAKIIYEDIKQLISLIYNAIEGNVELVMMNFFNERYNDINKWLEKPTKGKSMVHFTDPISCLERVNNATNKMNDLAAELNTQQTALNNLKCIFQPRKFQCNLENDIIAFDDDGIDIPIMSIKKINYNSRITEVHSKLGKSTLQIRREIFNDEHLLRKIKKEYQICKAVCCEILTDSLNTKSTEHLNYENLEGDLYCIRNNEGSSNIHKSSEGDLYCIRNEGSSNIHKSSEGDLYCIRNEGSSNIHKSSEGDLYCIRNNKGSSNIHKNSEGDLYCIRNNKGSSNIHKNSEGDLYCIRNNKGSSNIHKNSEGDLYCIRNNKGSSNIHKNSEGDLYCIRNNKGSSNIHKNSEGDLYCIRNNKGSSNIHKNSEGDLYCIRNNKGSSNIHKNSEGDLYCIRNNKGSSNIHKNSEGDLYCIRNNKGSSNIHKNSEGDLYCIRNNKGSSNIHKNSEGDLYCIRNNEGSSNIHKNSEGDLYCIRNNEGSSNIHNEQPQLTQNDANQMSQMVTEHSQMANLEFSDASNRSHNILTSKGNEHEYSNSDWDSQFNSNSSSLNSNFDSLSDYSSSLGVIQEICSESTKLCSMILPRCDLIYIRDENPCITKGRLN